MFGAILSRRKSLRLWPRRWRCGAGAEFVQQHSDAESDSGSDAKPDDHADADRDRDTHCYCDRDDRSNCDRDTYCYCNRVNRSKSSAYRDGYDRSKSNSDDDSSFITNAGRYSHCQRDRHCQRYGHCDCNCYSDCDTDFGAAISTTQYRHARPH